MQLLNKTQQETLQYCEFSVSGPLLLEVADVSRPFVYDRKFGLFYVGSGNHPHIMSMLLGFHNGYDGQYGGMEYAESVGLQWSAETADKYLETVRGTAFKSSVRPFVYAGKYKNLNEFELDMFGSVQYLFED